MSQKVAIADVRVHGTIYLGEHTTEDGTLAPLWSARSVEVMDWLCSGFQARFNQRRSNRSKYVFVDGVQVMDVAGVPVLVPIGRSVTTISDKQARQQFSFLAAVPAMVLQAPEKLEAQEWFAAVKRRKTNTAAGRPGGAMPQFRSRKKHDQRFVCWFNAGSNAVFAKTGKHSGAVTLTGQNPPGLKAPDGTCRWKVVIRVRLSQPVRAYTSVRVNWTRKELVFVNAPLPVTGRAGNGEMVGVDRGVTHTLALSDGTFYDAPDTLALEKKRRWHQKRMAKSRLVALREGRQFWASKRYQTHKTAAAGYSAAQARVRADWQQKVSTDLIRRFNYIGLEDLKIRNMTRRGKGTGAAAKRGLNRVMAGAALTQITELINYKTVLVGEPAEYANPAYTSQRCNKCGHTEKGNRESQAVFRCQKCGHTDNADSNAARNILDDCLAQRARTTGQPAAATGSGPAGSKSKTDPPPRVFPASAGTASAMNRKPPCSHAA